MNTHPEQWAAMLQHPGSSWGFGALLKDTSVVVLKEDTPPPTIPAGPEIRTHNLPLTSPTRYPLGHDCPYTKSNAPILSQILSQTPLQKKGVTTQRVYKVKQRCLTILNLKEKMRWSLRQAWPFQRTWRHQRASQNRRAFVFIKHIGFFFF